ncbi:MAG: polysaccharide deacetylase family protein, partial [Spirochaetales bacterium]|nr:polysaccharide deacetylase family protein [Spirochaetales bacterium]
SSDLYKDETVLWAPESDFLIYSKGGDIFYYSIEQFYKKKTLAEDFRRIGKGLISSVRWADNQSLFYLKDKTVYKIISAELFTNSLYSGLMSIGDVAGKIPFDFNPATDSFYISPDGKKLILNKSGTNVFLYFLKGSDYITAGDAVSFPYLHLPGNTRIKKVIWPSTDVVTILAGSILDGRTKNSVFRFDLSQNSQPPEFDKLKEENVYDIELSIDGSSAAVLYPDKIAIKNYISWETETSFEYKSPLKAFWVDDEQLVVTGLYTIEKYNISQHKSRILAVSQAEDAGFTEDNLIYARAGGSVFIRTADERWNKVNSFSAAKASTASDNYRTYLQPLSEGPYANIIMIRKLDSLGTESLFPYPKSEYDEFPEADEKVDLQNFTHGSRIRRRELSIVFNAVDSAEGLTDVLQVLKDYNIKATFFVNGNFIQQNPEAVKELSKSGHEVASLFYVYANLTDARYRMDKDFIKSGLARNEDDYFSLTGKELALFWHAPYYVVSSDIIEASSEMNYIYINRDVDTFEWAWSQSSRSGHMSVPDMVEKIMEKKQPGSIIPIRLGEGKAEEASLYSNLDLLLNNLIEKGYEVVPVSVLVGRVKH